MTPHLLEHSIGEDLMGLSYEPISSCRAGRNVGLRGKPDGLPHRPPPPRRGEVNLLHKSVHLAVGEGFFV